MPVHTSLSENAHGYTREDAPWSIDVQQKPDEGRLGHYLSGGGIPAFGRTIRQEVARLKHTRFLTKAIILGIIWLLLYIVPT